MTIRRNLLLCILPAVLPAAAATISFSFDSSLLIAQPGQTAAFRGTVLNIGPTAASINGDSVTFAFPINDTPFFSTIPAVLAPGAGAAGPLFTVPIPPGTPFNTYVGTFSILGGDTASAQNVLTRSSFGVQVVPEPGTLTMLSVGLFIAVLFRCGWARAR